MNARRHASTDGAVDTPTEVTMKRRLALWQLLFPLLPLAACTAPAEDPPHIKEPLPFPGIDLPAAPTGGHAPDGAEGIFLRGGDFAFTGDLVHGTATFDAAPVLDPELGWTPGTLGSTGSYDVTVAGVNYTSTAAESFAQVIPDREGGGEWLIVATYTLLPDAAGVEIATIVYVVVPAADFAVGATVALDGVDRVALFMTGPADAEEPEIVGAAVSGGIRFSAGGTAIGDTITAVVDGDFGQIEWDTPVDPGGGGSVVPGAYTLTISGPAEVRCDGSLTGHESDYAGLTPADVGFADGAVNVVAPDSATLTVDGTPITDGFGASTVDLLYSDGAYFGWTDRSEPGPAGTGTTLIATFLMVEGAPADPTLVAGWAGAAWEDSSGGMCQLAFAAELTGP
jgi:hypothetical protein